MERVPVIVRRRAGVGPVQVVQARHELVRRGPVWSRTVCTASAVTAASLVQLEGSPCEPTALRALVARARAELLPLEARRSRWPCEPGPLGELAILGRWAGRLRETGFLGCLWSTSRTCVLAPEVPEGAPRAAAGGGVARPSSAAGPWIPLCGVLRGTGSSGPPMVPCQAVAVLLGIGSRMRPWRRLLLVVPSLCLCSSVATTWPRRGLLLSAGDQPPHGNHRFG